MQLANYTPSNVARALGVGAWNDSPLRSARESFRVVLLPPFHVELCLTAHRNGDVAAIRVLSAGSQVWLQDSPWPVPVDSDEADCALEPAVFQDLAMKLHEAATRAPDRDEVLGDDMRAYGVLMAAGRRVAGVERPVSSSVVLERFVATLVRTVWEAIDVPEVRNALAAAGTYVGLDLATTPVDGAETHDVAVDEATEPTPPTQSAPPGDAVPDAP
jgi:hypothetical protein